MHPTDRNCRRFPGRMFLFLKARNVISGNFIDEALRHATLQVRHDNCNIVLPVHLKSGLSTPEWHVAGVFGSGKYRPAESPRTAAFAILAHIISGYAHFSQQRPYAFGRMAEHLCRVARRCPSLLQMLRCTPPPREQLRIHSAYG
jgi:hypothetical protein